jgi:hypothetical protein
MLGSMLSSSYIISYLFLTKPHLNYQSGMFGGRRDKPGEILASL